ncbi:MAG TPA: hypothetical protein VG944_06120 [Fimbriimonas sp.]|nr:hypothetical protein [Fimbriimonas sp.]
MASAAGLSIETTHYHVRLMAECGLLKPAGSRSSGKRPMTIYEPTEKRFVFPTASDAQDRLHSAKAMRAFVEIAASEFQSGGTALETRPYISRLYLSVDKKTLHKIIQLLNHTGDEMLKLPRVKDGIQASVTLLLTPT